MSITINALPFFGATLACFDPSDNTVIETTVAGTYNTTFSTCALLVPSNVQTSNATSPVWPTAATTWTHFVHFIPTDDINSVESNFIFFYSGATVVAKMTATVVGGPLNQYKLYTLQSGVLTLVGTVNLVQNALLTFDVQLTGNTASGTAALYSAGTLVFSGSSLNHSGWTGVTQIQLWGSFSSAGGDRVYWSQVIVDTTSTVGRFLRTDRLNTNSGTNTGWTGSVTDINEIPTNDATFISAASANLVSTFYESGLNLGTYVILARGVGSRVRREDASGPQNVQMAIRSGGANFFSASMATTVGFQAAFNSWTTDPNTSLAWTDANAASAESGAKSIA